ncbi:hypothetical protein NHQ30_000626 [Ciborinia camelliae]|nr:hypothetical protein NHQ30_000626 [Ciborinia camelliae]
MYNLSVEHLGGPIDDDVYTFGFRLVLFDTVTAAGTTSYPVIYASTTVTVTSGVNNVAAYGIIIERATDDPTWESSKTSSTPSSTASPILVSASSSSSSTSSISSPSNTGLTTGARAGVAVGVALGVLLIGAGAFLLCKRLRKRPRGSQTVHMAESSAQKPYYEKYNDGRQYDISPHVAEAPSTTLYQRGGELHGDSIRTPDILSELPGTCRTIPDYAGRMS